jgi:hypothetical protein
MSTKQSIKFMEDEFHLYHDVMDSVRGVEADELPVYLELRGVEFEANSYGTVTVTIKASTARKLGLLPERTT